MTNEAEVTDDSTSEPEESERSDGNLEEDPDATHTETPEVVEFNVSRPTVSQWADEWFGDADDTG